MDFFIPLKRFCSSLQIKRVDPTLDMEADAGDDYIHLPVRLYSLFLLHMQLDEDESDISLLSKDICSFYRNHELLILF